MGAGVEPDTRRCSAEFGMRFLIWNSNLPNPRIRNSTKSFLGEALRRDCTESVGMCLVFLSSAGSRKVQREPGSFLITGAKQVFVCMRILGGL